jgi:hypothetical protein
MVGWLTVTEAVPVMPIDADVTNTEAVYVPETEYDLWQVELEPVQSPDQEYE